MKPKPTLPAVAQEETTIDPETLSVLKSSYPDISAAPPAIRDMVEKAEKAALRLWETDLSQATESLKESRLILANIRDAKENHRRAWLGHLEKSATEWKAMADAYVKQQKHFDSLIADTKKNMKSAGQTVTAMNKKANQAMATDANEEEQAKAADQTKDNKEIELRERVQALLQQSIDLCSQDEPIDVDLEDEDAAPPKKRGRSAEPGTRSEDTLVS